MSVDHPRIEIFLNTHSSCSDVWPLFFSQLRKHWPDHPRVTMARDWQFYGDECDDCMLAAVGDRKVYYDAEATFGQQYLQGLSHVKSEFVLPLLEDMILLGKVDEKSIREYLRKDRWWNEHPLRLIKTRTHPHAKTVMFLTTCAMPEPPFNLIEDAYSMQPTIWRTDVLRQVIGDESDRQTPWEFESSYLDRPKMVFREIKQVEMNFKRGRMHWDSKVFPMWATALNKGKWNLSEYPECRALLDEYGIDPSKRGEV